MKKLLALLTVACMLFAFASCGKSEDTKDTVSASAPSAVQEEFKAPENYTTVLLVTINPQFRLYLDASGNVLALEPINDDAKSIKENISFENESYESVVEKIVTASKDGGFIKEDTSVKIEVAIVEEPKEADEQAKQEMKTTIENKVNETAEKLHIDVVVTVTEQTSGTASSEVATSDVTSSDTASVGSKPQTPVESKPPHTHSYSAATCTEAKKCSCGATEGSARGHDYKEGVCTRCGGKDPDYRTPVGKKDGVWVGNYLLNDKFYRVKLTLSGKGTGVGVDLALLITDDMKDKEFEETTTFDGKQYGFYAGDGCELKVTESGTKVIMTEDDDESLVLERTGENTFVAKKADGWFVKDFLKLPVGTVFEFSAKTK